MFSLRKPRRFHHEYIYADDRKRRLEDIERRAKEALGQADSNAEQQATPRDAERLRGAFTPANSHLHRHRHPYGVAFGGRLFLLVAVLLLLALIAFRLLLG